MPTTNQWFVITGGPSTGKTTLLAELEKRGYQTVPEAARLVIDEAVAKGLSVAELRADEEAFQATVAQRKKDIEAEADPATTMFFDRGMHDSLAYLQSYDFSRTRELDELLDQARYQKIFLLEPLPVYEKDYARTEDQNFIDNIHDLLHTAYSDYGMEPVLVPVLSPQERADFVLQTIALT